MDSSKGLRLSPEEIDAHVSQGLKKTQLVRATDWKKGKAQVVQGRSLNSIYVQAHRTKISGRAFLGHGNWYAYLRKTHGVQPRRGEKTSERLSDQDLHELVEKAIQTIKVISGKQWRDSERPVVNQHSLWSIYHQVRRRRKRGKAFFGHGTFEKYLEQEHGVVPADQWRWSDERLHTTVANLLRLHAPEKVGWSYSKKPVFQGKSLSNLWYLIRRSNRPKIGRTKIANPYFGQKTWKGYVTWIRRGGHLYPLNSKKRSKRSS